MLHDLPSVLFVCLFVPSTSCIFYWPVVVDAVHSLSQLLCVLEAAMPTVGTFLGIAASNNWLLQRSESGPCTAKPPLTKFSSIGTFESEDTCGVPWPHASVKMIICDWHNGGRQVER